MLTREEIRTCPGLYSLPPPQFEALAAIAIDRFVESGELFFQEGQVLHALYLLVSGSVAISRLWLKNNHTFVRSVMPGEFFGWSALQPPYRSSANAKALVDCQALAFAQTKLAPILKNDPDLALMLAEGATAVPEHIRHFPVERLARIIA